MDASPESVLGKTDYDLSPKHLAEQFRLDDAQVLEGSTILNRLDLVGRFDYAAAWCLTTKLPVRSANGEITGTSGITKQAGTAELSAPSHPDQGLSRALSFIREHHSAPYLSLAFFQSVGAAMPENFVLVRALREGQPVAASLLVRNATRLYGRHWGAVEHHPMLHFETCYYQAIEYAIARGLQVFEGGAQGEHKMARGLLPVTTQSAHWLAHPEFAEAVSRYLERETALLDEHGRTLAERNPFKSA
jgi:hypothetical protein